MNEDAFVVETPACDDKGVRIGTMRHYVMTEARAREEAAKVPERTWRRLPISDLPLKAREEMIRARAMSL